MSEPMDFVEPLLERWFGTMKHAHDPCEAQMGMWWKKDPELDGEFREQFGEAHARAAEGAFDALAEDARTRLGLVVLLDQISRNIHRDTPQAFAQDARAQKLCLDAIDRGLDLELRSMERAFLYMPLMHSEDAAVHERSIAAFKALAEAVPEEHRQPFLGNVDYAEQHAAIVRRFGRYPHRNAILGRETTPEEEAFLKEPGSSF